MKKQQCNQCGRFFTNKHEQKFCSNKCSGKARTKKVKINCAECGKVFLVGLSIFNGSHGELTCSRKCFGKRRSKIYVGENGTSWKGGRRFDKDGYVMIRMPEHPFARSGYVREHRIVMEKSIGRILEPWEIVHHINKDKSDNSIGNLKLFSNDADHQKHHYEYCGKRLNSK